MNVAILGKATRLQVLLRFAVNVGVRLDELIMAADVPASLVSNPDAHVTHALEQRLWTEAARLSADDAFGLHLAEWTCPEEHFDVLAFALRSCPTLGEHYRRMVRYVRLIHEDAYSSLEVEPGEARLAHGVIGDAIGWRHPVESMLAMAVLYGRRSVGDDFSPREVRFVHSAPPRTSEHERVFRAPVHYGCARNELVLDPADLDRPQKQAELRLRTVLERQLDDLMSRLSTHRSFATQVQQAILGELERGEPGVATISSKMHMTARTLQRRLEDEGTNFAKLVGDSRYQMARQYLQDSKRTITEVAFLLGFTEISSFHRAFKRWSGKTPAEFQRDADRSP